jgi:hypothetical protein
VSGRWDWNGNDYVWIGGRYEWVRGNWNWQGDQWVWVPGHYERERRGYRYREPRWEERDGAWISVQGSWEVGN